MSMRSSPARKTDSTCTRYIAVTPQTAVYAAAMWPRTAARLTAPYTLSYKILSAEGAYFFGGGSGRGYADGDADDAVFSARAVAAVYAAVDRGDLFELFTPYGVQLAVQKQRLVRLAFDAAAERGNVEQRLARIQPAALR